MTKNLVFGPNSASSVTRYRGELSWCTNSEKPNDPIFRKLSNEQMQGQTDGETDRRTDGRE